MEADSDHIDLLNFYNSLHIIIYHAWAGSDAHHFVVVRTVGERQRRRDSRMQAARAARLMIYDDIIVHRKINH